MTCRTLKDQLRRQLRFIETSGTHFDDGNDDESIRVAMAIRVMLHNTRKSTSLLTQLGANDRVKLLSTVGAIAVPAKGCADGVSDIFGGGRRLVNPRLGRHSGAAFVDVPSWWNQIFLARDGIAASRQSAVLMATNKDGGAHVDEDIGPIGALLRDGGFWTDGVMHGQSVDLSDIHLVALRQFGYELLNSPDLWALL